MPRLATYGTLRPGHPNHHFVSGIEGTWIPGSVRGHLTEGGWGSALGYPAIVLDEHGPLVAVDVLDSPDLDDHWPRLDDFEGSAYSRVRVEVSTTQGVIDAWIYVLAAESGAQQV
jgi:gamma-glutamylcyclotransferase (GGCT)/AIG2-like uncharacterized protein YtfP